MPVKSCQIGGRPGFKYGDRGTCYPYNPDSEESRNQARKRAESQGRAIKASGYKENR